MKVHLKRLAALRSRLHGERIVVVRQCPACGAWVHGSPGNTPCGRHPLAPPTEPGDRVIRIERSYGPEGERSRQH